MKKFCKKCEEETERNKAGVCKPCACVASNKWYYENMEKAKVSQKNYVEQNRKKLKLYLVQYKKNNRDRINELNKNWAEKNKDKVSLSNKKWCSKNNEKLRVIVRNRRAKLRTTGTLSVDIAAKLFKLQKGKCACCGEPLGSDYHLDHIMPIALGGENVDKNIQLLRARCNMQKQATHPVDFMQRRGFLL